MKQQPVAARSPHETDRIVSTSIAWRPRLLAAALVVTFLAANVLDAVAQAPVPAEADAEREAWRMEVPAYRVIGSGHPGDRPSDISPPDGLEFTRSGLLLITDSGNRRVQIWDVRTGERVGEFGSRFFGGEVTNVTVAPNGTVYVADSVLDLAYVFEPGTAPAKDVSSRLPANYRFRGTRFGDAGFEKFGGMVTDAQSRLYVADGKRWEVRRFLPDGTPDPTWKFTRTLPDGDTVLHRAEGMEIDVARSLLLVSSESDSVVKAFDLETGTFTRRLIGARPDASGRPVGKHVFAGVVEGIAIVAGHLLATDEADGHIHVFSLAGNGPFDTDLPGFAAERAKGGSAYKGFFGRTPTKNFDVDDSPNPDFATRARVEAGEITPGLVNAVGQFCSPDEIAGYTDPKTGESYVAIADQCNFRIVVYRWSDIERAMRRSEK